MSESVIYSHHFRLDRVKSGRLYLATRLLWPAEAPTSINRTLHDVLGAGASSNTRITNPDHPPVSPSLPCPSQVCLTAEVDLHRSAHPAEVGAARPLVQPQYRREARSMDSLPEAPDGQVSIYETLYCDFQGRTHHRIL